MLRLASDEDFNRNIVRGLLRLEPGLDIVRVQDAGLLGAADPAVLEWAAAEGRILLTHDQRTMPSHACQRLSDGHLMPGVFVVSRRLNLKRVVDDLLLLALASSPEEWDGRVFFLPL